MSSKINEDIQNILNSDKSNSEKINILMERMKEHSKINVENILNDNLNQNNNLDQNNNLNQDNNLDTYNNPTIQKRTYGLHFKRAHYLQLRASPKPIPILASLPLNVDLRSKCTPIMDQGNLGSCVSFSVCGMLNYLNPNFKHSELFLYYNTRKDIGTINYDSGSSMFDGVNAARKYGVCSRSLWPYNTKKYKIKPVSQTYKNAKLHQAIDYFNIPNDEKSIKNYLAQGYMTIAGIAVYSQFESYEANTTGIILMPTDKDSYLGGHAIGIVGYDDSKQWWICRNSWGTSWGDKGYFYLPYEYLLDPSLTTEIYVITTLEKGKNILF